MTVMQPTTYNTETELSSVNSILASIGQSPITTLNFENPEVSFVHNLLMETSQDVQNEGWVFNREEQYPLPILDNGTIPIANNMLRIDISDGQWLRTTDVVKRDGKLYDKINHSYYFDKPIKADITWLFPFEDLPSVFKRYITAKAATRAATQMVGNPQLTQLLASQEALTRAGCMEYECNQGDYTFFGTPDNTAYRSYQPYKTLAR